MKKTDQIHLDRIKEIAAGIGRQRVVVEDRRLDHLAEKHKLDKSQGELLELITASDDELAQNEFDFEDLPPADPAGNDDEQEAA